MDLSEEEAAEPEPRIIYDVTGEDSRPTSFRKRFEPGRPFAKGRLLALLAPVPKGCEALLSEKNHARSVYLFRSIVCRQ